VVGAVSVPRSCRAALRFWNGSVEDAEVSPCEVTASGASRVKGEVGAM
jgi:hypothetical protein